MSLALTIPTESELSSYKIIATIAASNPYWKKLGGSGDEKSIISTIFSVMLLARELGISPMQAVSGGINNIQGKFEISARLMNQLIRRHGHLLQVKFIDDTVCKMYAKRKDTGEEMECTYHIEEAARSGLVKPGSAWVKIPQDMLFARCISRLARRMFPDCIGGCYIEGEIRETVAKELIQSIDVPPISEFMIDEKPVQLQLPEDVNPQHIEKYLQECSSSRMSIEQVRKSASQNMESFMANFYKWREIQEEKVNPCVLEEMLTETE